jgi:hypothetical protein
VRDFVCAHARGATEPTTFNTKEDIVGGDGEGECDHKLDLREDSIHFFWEFLLVLVHFFPLF